MFQQTVMTDYDEANWWGKRESWYIHKKDAPTSNSKNKSHIWGCWMWLDCWAGLINHKTLDRSKGNYLAICLQPAGELLTFKITFDLCNYCVINIDKLDFADVFVR